MATTGTTRLKVYQAVLRELGLNTVTATGGEDLQSLTISQHFEPAVLYCFEQGYWNHAITTAQLATEGATTPLFGYTYPFNKPAGWLKTVRLSANNTYWPPLEDYEDSSAKFHANVSPLYAVYLATDPAWQYANWPEGFTTYVACELARRICKQLGGSQETFERVEKRAKDMRLDALSKDAMNEGVRYPPQGRWVLSRQRNSRGDRGNRGSLTG